MSQISQRGAAISKRPPSASLERVSWDDLRIFVIAARHDSFRKAAAVLRTSSSTITRRIERLEQELGLRLFDRLPEGVALTREGHRVLGAAQQMEQASLSLRRYLDQDLTTRGIVRCSVTEGLGTFWMLPKLADFHRANPFTVVDLRCTMDHTDVLRLETDVAVELTRPSSPDLKVTKLARLHVYPFAARRYLDTFGAPSSAADLVQHRIVDQVSPQFTEGTVPALLGLDSIEGIVAVRTNASTAHFYAVELGIGIGGLPTYAVPLGADVVPLDIGIRHHVDVWLIYHPDVREIPRVALFIDWLRDIFDPHRYPWFRDEFIHPNELAEWMQKRPERRIERARGVVADPRDIESAA